MMNISEAELKEMTQKTLSNMQDQRAIDNEEKVKELIKELIKDELSTLVRLTEENDYVKPNFQPLPPVHPDDGIPELIRATNYIIAYINGGINSD